MRVAIIGCSFSDYYSKINYTTGEFIEKGSWTYQLAKLYPKHIFKNYSKCGTGVDYHRLCFDECYDWADLIILQRTHPQRRSVFLNLLDANHLEWKMSTNFENYRVVTCNMAVVGWTGETFLDDFGDWTAIPHYKRILKMMKEIHPYVATNNLMKDADNKWYQNVSKDPKVHVISFNTYTHKNAWQVFPQPFNNRENNIKHWHELGYVIYEDDEHCTKKGHTKVLNDYILSEDLKCKLQ